MERDRRRWRKQGVREGRKQGDAEASMRAQRGDHVFEWDFQIPSPHPKQIPLLIQSCRQRYRYFTAKNIDRISTYKNKRCILGVFHPSCNAFFVVFIALPRDLPQHSCRPIVKQPLFVKLLFNNHFFSISLKSSSGVLIGAML